MQNSEPIVRRVIRGNAVRAITSLSRSCLREMEAAGDFPQRVQLGPRAVGWYEDEVISWLATRQRKAS